VSKRNGPAETAISRDPAHRRKEPTVDRAEYIERSADYREYLAFIRGADEELKEIRGYGFLPSEREDYTRLFYADEYRRDLGGSKNTSEGTCATGV
jgi:hypothetical protein